MKFFYPLFFCLLPFLSLGQQKSPLFNCQVPEIAIPKGQPFKLVYSFNFGESDDKSTKTAIIDSFLLPTWVEDRVTNEPIVSYEFQYVNGKMSKTTSYTYFVTVQDTGTYQIPSASFVWNNTIVKSNAVEIKVIADKTSKGKAFLATELSRSTICVGEQALLNLILYAEKSIIPPSSHVMADAKVAGEFTQNIITEYKYDNKTIEVIEKEGVFYQKHILKQYVISPLLMGEIVIVLPEVNIEHQTIFPATKPNNTEIFMETLYFEDNLELQVLSTKDKKANFAAKDIVSIKMAINNTDDLAKGIVLVDIEVKGYGNPVFWAPPALQINNITNNVQVSLISEKTFIENNLIESQRKFQYKVIFYQTGISEIISQWNTWDSKQQEWITHTDSKTVTVTHNSTISTDSIHNISTNSTQDIIFVVDVSSSMMAQDISPSRIAAMKGLFEDVINKKQAAQRMSIIAFSGSALTICPLTFEKDKLLAAVSQLSVDLFKKDGTAIGAALLLGLMELEASANNASSILLFTDGVQNEGYSPLMVAQMAVQKKIIIHTIAMGIDGVVAIAPLAKKPNGEYFYGKSTIRVDESLLMNISQKTGGTYNKLTNKDNINIDLNMMLMTTKKMDMYKDEIPNELINILIENAKLTNK